MPEAKKAYSRQVAFQAEKLTKCFEKGRWADASDALQGIAEIAQNLQRVDLSLMAQSLKSDLDIRMNGAGASIMGEVSDRYEDLVRRLDHLRWIGQA